MDALVQAQCKKLIFSSTCAIYGTPEQLPMHEQLPFHPESVYGESKHICEKMFSWIAQLEEIDTVFFAILMPQARASVMEKRIYQRPT